MKNCLRANLILPTFLVGGAVAGLFFSPMRRRDVDRVPAARWQVEAFHTALGAYHTDTGEYPTTAQGLAALRIAPAGVKGWSGPYLPKDIPNDPWGQPYGYRFPGQHGPLPDVWSSR